MLPSEDSLLLVKSGKLVAILFLQKGDKWARVYPSHWPTTTATTTVTTAATAASGASANFANETAHNQHFVGRGQEFEKLFFVNEADGTLL